MLIDKTFVSRNSKPYLISEIGLNHNGNFNEAINLIDDSHSANCNAVKFQIRSKSFFKAKVEKMEIGQQYVYEYVKNTYLTFEEYSKLFKYAEKLNLDVLVSCWDIDSLYFAKEVGIKTIKIASADLTNRLMIEKIVNLFENIIMSTGMSTQEEIEKSISYILEKSKNLCILHCSSTYPAPINTLNLNFISRLRLTYPDLLVGYSGHELEYHVCLVAQALGANVFEKHITRNKLFRGNDHKVSLLKEEMLNLKNMLLDGYQCLGSSENRLIQAGEKMNRVSLAKSLSLREDKKRGHLIKLNDLTFIPGGKGIAPDKYELILDKKLIRDKLSGDILELIDFKEFYNQESLNLSPIKNCDLGIPVRYHDAKILHKEIETSFLEFHLSYKDIDTSLNEIKEIFQNLNFAADHTFHAPDFYSNDLIFDPFNENLEIRKQSDIEFRRFLDHISIVRNFYLKKSNKKTKVITSFSCATLFKLYSLEDKQIKYKKLKEYIQDINACYPELTILPQTLPVNAWYLGGRRYVNIFADPREIYEYCKQSNLKICLDTAHTIMACNFYNLNSEEWLIKLLKFADHVHLVDAMGDMDEGLNFGDGDLNLPKFTDEMTVCDKLSYIPEIWQGHHNLGEGFKEAIKRIATLVSE